MDARPARAGNGSKISRRDEGESKTIQRGDNLRARDIKGKDMQPAEPVKGWTGGRTGERARGRTGEHERSWPRSDAGRACNRRTFLVAAGTLSGVLALPAGARLQESTASWEQAVKEVLGSAKPTDVKMLLEMPEIAENGNTVPFTVSLDNPMTDKDYVKAIHVIATANPQPGVASFHFTPLSGKAAASSRARLARTQDVIAIAELSNGTFLMSKRSVKVTIGGCGG